MINIKGSLFLLKEFQCEKMLNISVDILAFGSFLDLPIIFQCQWLMAVEGMNEY